MFIGKLGSVINQLFMYKILTLYLNVTPYIHVVLFRFVYYVAKKYQIVLVFLLHQDGGCIQEIH